MEDGTVLADLAALEQALGVSFAERSILKQSLLHSSYVNENPGVALDSNERLEFLGDAVLGFVIAEKLYHDLPESSEGGLTTRRSALISQDTLARVARAIGLGDYLYLGKGEQASGGRHKPTNLAGALEAVIAVVFLDQGLAAARGLILRLFQPALQKVISQGATTDYKTQLQEFIQAKYQQVPSYQLVEVTGPDHARKFTAEVKLDEAVLGRGSGRSKKMAETEAARVALKQLSADFTD
ncbi:MAG: ribonuclease III [Chloroflexi bacterium]|nr:ribonuclease III [Chloroflexota bacterium]